MRTADGSWTALEPGTGRALHDLAGARTEARLRFAQAAGLDRVPAGACVELLDLGCGFGHNLAAAEELAHARGFELSVLALERDPRVWAAAEHLPPDPAYGFEAARRRVRERLERGAAGWELRFGPAELEERTLGQRRFDAVFLDGYAPSTADSLWEAEFLARVARRLRPGGLVTTYTASSRIRAAFMAAGLEVGVGPRVGRRVGGTVARRTSGRAANTDELAVDGVDPERAEALLEPSWSPLEDGQRRKLERRGRRIADQLTCDGKSQVG
ncbi:MAG: MnmC family methyltransferase [Planctomycetota bacterium]